MAKTTTNKTLFYKRVSGLSDGQSLQSVLHQGLGEKEAVVSRQRSMGSNENEFHVLNNHRIQKRMLLGELVYYTAGMNHKALAYDINDTEFALEDVEPPKMEDGKRREFVDSTLYFGVLDNHVVIAQSAALRSKDLEHYLNWFLLECAGVLDTEAMVILGDNPTAPTERKIKAAKVKSVSLGAPLYGEALEFVGGGDIEPVGRTKKIQFTPKGIGFSALQAVLGEEWFNQLRLDDALDNANLQVKVELTYLRKTTENAQKMLDNVALAMRHSDPEDTTITLSTGEKIKGSELKTSSPIRVEVRNGKMDREDIYSGIVEWFYGRIKSGVIEVA